MQQAIIQILDAIAKESMESFWESIGTDVYPTWISTAKERIQTLWDGWISVTERLPEYFVNVLTINLEWQQCVRRLLSDSWSSPWLWISIEEITHWMPLPLPPVTK